MYTENATAVIDMTTTIDMFRISDITVRLQKSECYYHI